MKSTSCTPSPVRRRALAVALCALLATAPLGRLRAADRRIASPGYLHRENICRTH